MGIDYMELLLFDAVVTLGDNTCGIMTLGAGLDGRRLSDAAGRSILARNVGRSDDTVGNPHRAQVYQFELFELEFLTSNFSSLSSS